MFYRSAGVRRPQQLLSPVLIPESTLQLPRDAILHYTERESNKTQLNDQMPVFDQYTKRIMVDHVTELAEGLGKPMRNGVQSTVLIREFHQANKKFKFGVNSHDSVSDPMTLIVQNYSFLDDLYRYVPVPITDYHRWYNVQKTLWTRIAEIVKVSQREHFLFADLPAVLPSFATLNRFMGQADTMFVKNFESPEKMFIMEIWKWLSVEFKAESVISLVPEDQLFKVNLVFKDHGEVSVLNLGYLQTWLKGSLTELKDSGSLKLDNLQLQKFFLKYTIQLKTTDLPEPELPEEVAAPAGYPEPTQEPEEDDLDESGGFGVGFKGGAAGAVNAPSVAKPAVNLDVDEEDTSETFNLDKELSNIDEELKTLDLVEKKAKLGDTVVIRAADSVKDNVDVPDQVKVYDTLHEEIYKPKTPEQCLTDQVDLLSEFGVMSAAEIRAARRQIDAIQQLPDPYGKFHTIAEAAVVKPEDVAITKEDKQLKGNDILLDKSMTESSIKSFDSKYVTTVLPKDILGCVQSVQRAGVIVTEHTVEEEDSVIGAYEYHTVKIKPIDGAASTIRFKIPKVSEEGQILVQGSKYVLRKQQVD